MQPTITRYLCQCVRCRQLQLLHGDGQGGIAEDPPDTCPACGGQVFLISSTIGETEPETEDSPA